MRGQRRFQGRVPETNMSKKTPDARERRAIASLAWDASQATQRLAERL